MSAYTPFPVHVLPEPLAAFVREASAALGCDPAYVAVPLLAVAGSAIGNTRTIRLKDSWSEPSVIWTALVAESGTMKSPANDLATRPAWRRQYSLLMDHRAAQSAYESERKKWKAAKREDRDDEPEPPEPCQHVLCQDITTEGLAVRLLHTPRGTLVAPEELSGWFGSFNRYTGGGADVAHWLCLHGARALKVDRKHGDRPTIYVPRAAVSLTGTIQPGTLRRALMPEYFESGLAARLLLAWPPERPKRWTDATVDPAVMRRLDVLFDRLYGTSMGTDGDPVSVALDDASLRTWITFYDEHAATIQAATGADRALLSKIEGYAARLALVHHCCTGTDADHITLTSIEAGIDLARWFADETLRVYRLLSESDDDRRRRELVTWIEARGGSVTVRELQRGPRAYRQADAAEAAISELVEAGLGEWRTPNREGPGHPFPSQFTLLPTGDRRHNSVFPEESGNSVTVAASPGNKNGHPHPAKVEVEL